MQRSSETIGTIAAALATGAIPAPTDTAAEPPPVLPADERAAGVVAGVLAAQGWRLGDDPGRAVRAEVRTAPWAAARQAAQQEFGPDGWARLSAAAGQRAWRLVMERVATPLRTRLGEDLAELSRSGVEWAAAARARLLDAVYGQHDAAWLATFAAADTLRPGLGATDGPAGPDTTDSPANLSATDGPAGLGVMEGLGGLAEVARHAG